MKTIHFLFALMSFHTAFPQTTSSDEQIIRQARQASNAAIARQDVEAIASIWLEDYVVIRGSGSVEQGKATNVASWKKLFADAPQTRYERIPSEITISKNNPELAWESGEWKGFNTYSNGGRYSAQWKKKDGRWMMQAELFVALEK